MTFQEMSGPKKSQIIDKFMSNVNSDLKKFATYTDNSSYADAFNTAMAMLKDAKTQAEYYALQNTEGNSYKSNSDYAYGLKEIIPDLTEIVIQCPFTLHGSERSTKTSSRCYETVALWSLIQHMNDNHKATREQIADYLDELHDSGIVNLTLTNLNPDRG